MSLAPLAPTATLPLFPELGQALIALLRDQPPAAWDRPTACAGWSVKDLAAHLLGGSLGRLSMPRPASVLSAGSQLSNAELIAWIDQLNDLWVRAARRMSPAVLLDLLAHTDAQLQALFESLAPDERSGLGVAWAGESASANWLDIGREYTEKWFHQQHIRDALGAPGMAERRFALPVVEIGLRALPFTYRATPAPDGAALGVAVTGAAAGAWALLREGGAWELYAGTPERPSAQVTLADDTLWRLITRGLTPEQARAAARVDGDAALAAPFFQMVAIMA